MTGTDSNLFLDFGFAVVIAARVQLDILPRAKFALPDADAFESDSTHIDNALGIQNFNSFRPNQHTVYGAAGDHFNPEQ